MSLEGEGLVALQSLLTAKKGSFNFLASEHYLKFLRRQVAISQFLSDAFRSNTRWGGGIRLPIAFKLKKVLENLSTNPMRPPSEVYTTALSRKNLISPKDITYNPYPEGWGGGL